MVKLTPEEETVLAALSFVSGCRRPVAAGLIAKRAKLSTQKTTPMLQHLVARKLARKMPGGYVMTAQGDKALDDNWIPDPTSIGANRQWLEANSAAYWGRHVALRRNQLVAEGKDGHELFARLKAMEPHERVLIVPLVEVGPLWVIEDERGAAG